MRSVCGRRLLLALLAVACLHAGAASGAEAVHGRTSAEGKPLQYAVVWLDAPGAPRTPQKGKVVLDQRDMTFIPHVLAVRVGTVVDFPNNDRVLHNVFSFHDGKRFDLGLYPVGAVRHVTFDHAGLSRIYCNIHPHMAAYVMAVDTPYFAVSSRDGTFTLKGVPDGAYHYHAWRPGGTDLEGTVTVGKSGTWEVHWP